MTFRAETPREALAASLHDDADLDHESKPGCCGLWEVDYAQAGRLEEFMSAYSWHLSADLSLPDAPKGQRPTSRAAAESLGDLSAHQSLVLDLIACHGEHGLTDEELGTQFPGFAQANSLRPIAADSPRKRRAELSASGHVVDSGRTRPNRSGREATVWCARSAQAVAA